MEYKFDYKANDSITEIDNVLAPPRGTPFGLQKGMVDVRVAQCLICLLHLDIIILSYCYLPSTMRKKPFSFFLRISIAFFVMSLRGGSLDPLSMSYFMVLGFSKPM